MGWNVQELPDLVCVLSEVMEYWNVEGYCTLILDWLNVGLNNTLFDDVIGEHEPIFFI